MDKILDGIIILTQKLNEKTFETGYTFGQFILDKDDIDIITLLDKNNLIELLTTDNKTIEVDELSDYLNVVIKLEIKTGSVNNYFNSIKDFVNGNKLECRHKDFYILEINYRENLDDNMYINKYKNNLLIIDFLRNISDNVKLFGNQLELFFYKSGRGLDFKIEYEYEQLENLDFNIAHDFKSQFFESFNGEDKKQLFINELITFLDKYGKSYVKLIENWNILVLNYEKSYSLFIAGFSFEKIKTSSNEYFQKLIDRIYESISKASSYIFGIPIGYILLINNFDYSGVFWIKNIVLLVLGFVFFILIWFVLFKNIDESIDAIENDITDFLNKINDVKELNEISDKLENLKTKELKNQRFKLSLVKYLTILILLLISLVFFYIFIDISIFLI